MNEWLRARTEGARLLWQRLSAPQKASLVGAALAVVIAVGLLVTSSTKTDYQPLFSNLNSKDAGTIQSKLTDQKVDYKVSGNGSTIEVPADQVYELRNSLAVEGLPSGSNVMGYELFDKYSGIGGGTDFTQKIDKQRALEGELARTIASVDGVDAATVRLVLSEQELYSDKEKPASASVFLKLNKNGELASGSVKGIMNLVSSSVQGLDSKKVTVVDTEGNILSNLNDAAPASLAKNQISLQRSIEQSYADKVQTMLDTALGPGKSVAQVSVELDWTSREIKRKTLGKPIAEAEETSKESYTGIQPSQGGIAGVTPNTPNTYQGITGTQNSPGTQYSKTETKVRNTVPETEITETVQPGSIKKLSVSVLYDSGQATTAQTGAGVPAQVAASIQQIAQTAVGIDTRRGDRVTVAQMPFDTSAKQQASTEIAAAQRQQVTSAAVKYGLTAVGLMLMLLFLRRGLRPVIRPLPAFEPALPEGAGAIQGPVPISELQIEERSAEEQKALKELERKRQEFHPDLALEEGARRTEIQDRVEEMVADKPMDVARLLSTWLLDKQRR